MINKSITALLDFILPRICVSCGHKLSLYEKIICPLCSNSIEYVSEELIEHEFRRKFFNDGYISGLFSLYQFEKGEAVQDLIHSLKYHGRFQNGIYLGEKLGQTALDKLNQWRIDVIIPVPLHTVKKAERGFNQSDYIARGLNKVTLIPYQFHALKRIRHTESQTNLNAVQRKENLKDAFKVIRKDLVTGRNIAVLDDVITSGSTMTECAKALLDNQAAKVYVLSAALA
ncbi:MAG: ComF family protein [Ignavibacteria bacterium]